MVQVPKYLVAIVALVVLAALTSPVFADETKGKIKSVDADKKTFVMTDKDAKDWTFHLAPDGKVKLADKDVKFTDLKVGEQATIIYTKKGNDLIASEVRCEKK